MFWPRIIASAAFACLFVVGCWGQIIGDNQREDYRRRELARSSTAFGWSLYRQLVDQEGSNANVLVSPFSVFAALSMTLLGTDGSTKQQVRDVLAQDARQGIHHSLRSFMDSIPNSPSANVTLRVANALFYDARQVNLAYSFRSNIRSRYGAYPRMLERPDPESAANDWILRQTGGKISDFFSPGQITPDTVLLLLNAVFFQGTWKDIFDEKQTSEREFTMAFGQRVRVPMMMRDGGYKVKSLGGQLRTQVLELPFGTDGRFSLFILLPESHNGLTDLEMELTPQSLEEAVTNMPEATRFMISVPKFKLQMKTSVKEALQAMGLTHIFSNQADLSRMADRRLKVSDVVHEAVLEVDEKGTTAAAVSSIGVVPVSLPPSFIADHPFLMILRDNVARLNLFMGCLNDPSQQQ